MDFILPASLGSKYGARGYVICPGSHRKLAKPRIKPTSLEVLVTKTVVPDPWLVGNMLPMRPSDTAHGYKKFCLPQIQISSGQQEEKNMMLYSKCSRLLPTASSDWVLLY